MEKIKKIVLLLSLITFLYSCGSASDAAKVLRNEKIRSTDAFLVEKKGPLVLPPDYNEIPAPDTIIEKNKNDENKIKRILKAPINENKATNNSSSVEKSILEKIRK